MQQNTQLFLHCDANYGQFTLVTNDPSTHTFRSVKDALNFAATIVTEKTPLVVYNPLGAEIVHTTVHPTAGGLSATVKIG